MQGIRPIKPLREEIPGWNCLFCNSWLDAADKTPDHECNDDGVLHGDCVEEFLHTDQGRAVIFDDLHVQIYDQILQLEGGVSGHQPEWVEEF